MKVTKGFTLIELLIAFAVIAVLSGLTIASYRTTTETRNLESEVRRIVDTLNLAYKKGYAAETGPLAQCADFIGYQVALQPAAKRYLLTKCCNAACAGAQSTIISTHTVPHTNLTFVTPSANTQFQFKPLAVQTVILPVGAGGTITLRNAVIGKCITLNINGVGAIQENAKVNC